MPSSMNENPPVPTVPFMDEGEPGLGRRSDLIDRQRTGTPMQIGGVPTGPAGLPDDSPENPVRDGAEPMRIKR